MMRLNKVRIVLFLIAFVSLFVNINAAIPICLVCLMVFILGLIGSNACAESFGFINPKRVYTKYGLYYIHIDKKNIKYSLLKDNIFYINEIAYTNESDLKETLEFFKGKIDAIHKDKYEQYNKKKALLDEWDGYFTTDEKRDNKIKNLIR